MKRHTTRTRETFRMKRVEFRRASSFQLNLCNGRGGRRGKRVSTVPAKFSNNGIDLRAVQDLFFEQHLRYLMQQPEIGLEQILSPMVALLDDPSDLGVDLDSRVLGVIDFLSKISSQKDLFLLLTEGHGAELFAHTPFAHHPPR